MTTLNLLKKKNVLLAFATAFALNLSAQEPVATENTEITGATIDYYFHEQNDSKFQPASNILDGDVDTDWAGNATVNGADNTDLVFNLKGKYSLAEIQYLTVTKTPSYRFKIFVSTTDTNDYTAATFTEYFTDQQDGDGYLLSNLDNTYKSFVFSSPIANATFVKFQCFGRSDSSWNTISELKFYQEGAVASVEENELQLSSLYPVPANNKLLLNNFDNKVKSIVVYSLQGKRIMNLTTNFSDKVEINTSSLVNGVYLVKLSNVNNVSIGKLITVQH